MNENKKSPGMIMKGIGLINKFLLICSGIALVFITLLITADVAGRAFFKLPIQGTTELVECVTSCVAFMGLGVCTKAKQHIKVEFIVERFPANVQKCFDVFNYLIVIGITSIISVESFLQGMHQMSVGACGYISKLPYWPFYMLVALSFALMTVNTIFLMLSTITGKEIAAE